MIKHYCDGCGKEVTEDTGIIKMKELTLEFPNKKISIAIEVDSMDKNFNSDKNPAVCADCVTMRFNDWAKNVSNTPVDWRA